MFSQVTGNVGVSDGTVGCVASFYRIFRKRIVELYESYMYFGVINAVLITLILQRMSKHRYLDVEV